LKIQTELRTIETKDEVDYLFSHGEVWEFRRGERCMCVCVFRRTRKPSHWNL